MTSNNSCTLLAALLLTALPCNLSSQGSGHLTVGSPAMVSGKRNDSVQAKIPVSVESGFHVNANPASAENLIPISLTWSATGALEGGKVTYPKPAKEMVAGEPLSVLTGKFDLVASFKVAANAPAGPGVAAGKLRYQACNSTTCFIPKTVEITLPYQIQ